MVDHGIADAKKIARVTKFGTMAQTAMEKTKSSRALSPLKRLTAALQREVDLKVSGSTGKLSAQTEGSGINMLRLALGAGAGAGGRRSSPV